MHARFFGITPATLLLFAPVLSSAPAGTPDGETGIHIVARVDGRVFPASGRGECRTSAESTIYDVPVTQWGATWDGAEGGSLENVNVTVWRPKAGGADQVTLWLTAAGKTHRIATVAGGEILGRATASARRQGDGGTLVVDGVTKEGTAIKLELICDAFSEIVDGNG
jgi:hypothetical protein